MDFKFTAFRFLAAFSAQLTIFSPKGEEMLCPVGGEPMRDVPGADQASFFLIRDASAFFAGVLNLIGPSHLTGRGRTLLGWTWMPSVDGLHGVGPTGSFKVAGVSFVGQLQRVDHG